MNDDITINLIGNALDACEMRQTAYAQNMANIHADGYQPISVNFEQQLETLSVDETSSIVKIKPFYQVNQNSLTFEQIMVQSVQNTTHYKALIKGINEKLALMNIALHGNNQ